MNRYTWALLSVAVLPTNAFFLMPCWPVSTQRLDPIVDPDSVSAHVHQIAGGGGFAPNMSYSDTQAASCTTCFVESDKSNYWIPAMYMKHSDGTFERVEQVGSASMYYFNEPSRLGPGEKFEPFPKGLRMVAGDPYKRSPGTDAASMAINYKCLNYAGSPTDSKTFPPGNCPDGVRAEVTYPSCWDGQNLDSDDHKSHMAYPTQDFENGACPSSHPHHVVILKVEFIFDTNSFKDQWTGGQQPFVWSSGDSTGYGLHADYMMGWDYDLLSSAVDQCMDEYGVLANCAPFAGKIQSAYVNPGTCKVSSFVDEDVGGTVSAMPGCNEVQGGPSAAIKQKCSDDTKLLGSWANGKVDSVVSDLSLGSSSTDVSANVAVVSTQPAVQQATTSVQAAQQPAASSTTLATSPATSPITTATIIPATTPATTPAQPAATTAAGAAGVGMWENDKYSPPEGEKVTIVTITDYITETSYTTLYEPTQPARLAVKREIGDDYHKHHLRRIQRRRGRHQHSHH